MADKQETCDDCHIEGANPMDNDVIDLCPRHASVEALQRIAGRLAVAVLQEHYEDARDFAVQLKPVEEKEIVMNIYEVTYRNKGRALELYRRSVLAESLQGAIDLVEEEMPMESHEEYVSVAETARNVLLPPVVKQPKKKQAAKAAHGK